MSVIGGTEKERKRVNREEMGGGGGGGRGGYCSFVCF